MKKIIVISFFFLLTMLGARGQSLKTVLTNMPRDIIYGLTPNMIQELLENPKDTAKFVSTAIYPHIKRKKMTEDYISLETSKVGRTDIKLLPLINNSKIICLIQTVCGTVCDSKISFFTDKWEPIDGTELFPEKTIGWFIKEDADRVGEKFSHAMASLNMLPVKYSFSGGGDTAISAEFCPKSYLSVEDYKGMETFLTKEPKSFVWDKVSFKKSE